MQTITKILIINFLFLILLLIGLYAHGQSETSIKQLSGYWAQKQDTGVSGVSRDFRLVLDFEYDENKKLCCTGYWLENNFFNNQFQLSVISLNENNQKLQMNFPDDDCLVNAIIDYPSEKLTATFFCGNEIEHFELYKTDPKLLSALFSRFDAKFYGAGYAYQIPQKTDDGIEITTPKKTDLNKQVLENMIDEIIAGEYGRINSFLLMKDGKLVCEEYFFGYDKNTLHQIESCTKSISSMLIGIACDHGKIKNMNQYVYTFFTGYPEILFEKAKGINLHQLLTMTAGFDHDNIEEMFASEDWFGHILSRSVIDKPGTEFYYDYGSSVLLAGIIKSATGIHADKFAAKHLFQPLGIKHYNWEALKNNGYPLTGGSLQMLPRDMAKIGQLVLDNGKWKGRQIISEKWIIESTRAQVESHINGDYYGYQWWRVTITSKNNDYDVIWANGLGSQFIFIFPELNMVVVTTGFNYEGEKSWDIFGLFQKYLTELSN